MEALQARREWQGIFKVLKEKNLYSRRVYPVKISFKHEGEIDFPDKQKLRDFITIISVLQEMPKAVLLSEKKRMSMSNKKISGGTKFTVIVSTQSNTEHCNTVIVVFKLLMS